MNKNWKKLLAAFLLSTMIFSLSACKKDRNPVGDENGEGEQSGGSGIVGSVSYSDMVKKIEDAKKENEFVKAWMTIPGTNIDLPIVYNPNEDNDYYLFKDLAGNETGSNGQSWEDTVVYADFRTQFDPQMLFSSNNFVLYGHNWNNIRQPLVIGDDPDYTMFGQLPSYTDQKFFEQHPYIYFSTEDNEMVWKIYAAFYCEQDWTPEVGFNYNDPNLTPQQMSTLLIEQSERNQFVTDVNVNANDKILTLSTCSRVIEGAGDEQRFVVVARLLREGESDKDPIVVYENEKPKAPVL